MERMSILDNPESIKLLQNLLSPKEDSSDAEDDYYPPNPTTKLNPGNIGFSPMKVASNLNNKTNENEDARKDGNEKNVEMHRNGNNDPEEILENWLEKQEKDDTDALENRKVPSYSVVFKQSVTPEDIYLQMGNKTGATISCEDILIQIEMPEETVNVGEMDLSVTESLIDLKTPVYRLKLPLPNKIDPDKGKASFDSDRKVLTLTLRLNREFDFVNF